MFKNPKLYKSLIAEYENHVVPVKELPFILQRFYNITAKASENATEVFVENASLLNLIDANGVLRFDANSKSVQPEVAPQQIQERKVEANEPSRKEVDEDEDKAETKERVSREALPQVRPLELAEMNNAEKEKLRLINNRFMYLTFPSDLSKADIQVIRRWCDMVELTLP